MSVLLYGNSCQMSSADKTFPTQRAALHVPPLEEIATGKSEITFRISRMLVSAVFSAGKSAE